MTTTTTAPTADFYQDHEYGPSPTAADLRHMADLLDLVGHEVRLSGRDPMDNMVGRLDKVYFTDGVAVNIVGDHGDFSFGPLYGATVEAV